MKEDFLKFCDEILAGLKWTRENRTYEMCDERIEKMMEFERAAIWERVKEHAERLI